jgi:hypothetical protein
VIGVDRGREGKTIMEGFLILSGALALLIGLLAMIEGRWRWFGTLRRRKSEP